MNRETEQAKNTQGQAKPATGKGAVPKVYAKGMPRNFKRSRPSHNPGAVRSGRGR